MRGPPGGEAPQAPARSVSQEHPPLVHATARGGAREDVFYAGVYGVEVAEELHQVEVQVREKPVIVEEGKPAQIGWMGRGCTV